MKIKKIIDVKNRNMHSNLLLSIFFSRINKPLYILSFDKFEK